MSTKIIPTIGRVVWYKDTTMSDQMLSAQVAYVHNEDTVNLLIASKIGMPFGANDVPFFHGDADDCPELSCCWMPYQKKQAEKHAADEASGD